MNDQNAKFDELVKKLKEIFQMDKPELDFGIYKIINTRAQLIDDFLQNDLRGKVRVALQSQADAEAETLEKEIAEATAQAKGLGMTAADSPKIRELLARRDALSAALDNESQVYSHLLTFFSRYYDRGDFISKRRYKGDVYALPYSGEEVKLVWANQDQYYTKSGENFTNYDFKLPDGKKVHFKLVTADTARDNLKDNDGVRCFVLWDPASAPEIDPEDENPPVYPANFLEEKDGELFIYFQYRKFPRGTKQDDFSKEAKQRILQEVQSQNPALAFINLLAPAPTEKNSARTIFDRELERYVAKNTSDYFIHKDLKTFLTRELDFYIKNEMMHLDDLQSATEFKHIEANLRLIQAVRVIARELICFMAQIEDFQKKLWLKKKFVTQCDYCLTLDRVPEDLYPEIFANEKQRSEWSRLFPGLEIPKQLNPFSVGGGG